MRRSVLPFPTLAYHRVQPDAGELRHIGLGADPVVAQEHHGLAAVLMGDVHEFSGQRRHLAPLEGLEVQVFLAGHTVLVVVVALVDDVLGPEGIAHFLFKALQDIGGHGGRIAVPVTYFCRLSSSKTSVNWWKNVV